MPIAAARRGTLLTTMFGLAVAIFWIPASAQIRLDQQWGRASIGGERYLLERCKAVYIVTVDAPPNPGPFTNENSPEVKARVEGALKGEAADGPTTIVWKGWATDDETVGARHVANEAAWRSKPIVPPEAGSRWIIMAQYPGAAISTVPGDRVPYSPDFERRVKYVLEAGPAWFAEEAKRGRGIAAERADAQAELAADLEKLCAASTDIIIAHHSERRTGMGSCLDSYDDVERLLDSRPADPQPPSRAVWADARFDARRMVSQRLDRASKAARDVPPKERRALARGQRFIVFLRASDDTSIEDSTVSAPDLDRRTFVYADNTNGLLLATPERIESVRKILAARRPTP